MKVLIFINTSWNIYNFRAGLIRGLQNKGYEVHVMAPEDSYSVRLTAMGCMYHPISMNNSGSNPLKELVLLGRIYRLYRQVQPRVILHYTIKPNLYGTLAAHWCRIPCINNVSGLGTVFLTDHFNNRIARYLYQWIFRYPQKIYFQNAHDLQQFQKEGLLSQSNFEVIPGSGINTAKFTPLPTPSRQPFTFLMMARLLEEKGVREYAEAAKILNDKGLQVKCLLLGNREPDHKRGIPSQALDRWIKEGYIEYLGEAVDVRPFIGKAHVVVLPSYREGLPKSLLEGASMAKPLIASRVPGCTEVVKEQINGLLCVPKSGKDLAAKMETMYQFSDETLLQLGTSGRDLVKKEFEEQAVVNQYIQCVEHLVKQNNV